MTKTLQQLEKGNEYKNLVDLQALHSEAHARLAELEADLQREYLDLVDNHRPEYAEIQSKITEAETALEILARAHQEWFGESRNVKTPYGVVKFHKGSKIEADDEEVSILLIEQAHEKSGAVGESPFIKIKKTLAKEALEKLTDDELARFRIKRVEDDNFSVTPGKVDLGKAVKAKEKAEKKEAA